VPGVPGVRIAATDNAPKTANRPRPSNPLWRQSRVPLMGVGCLSDLSFQRRVPLTQEASWAMTSPPSYYVVP
jgi:hypothetical protein